VTKADDVLGAGVRAALVTQHVVDQVDGGRLSSVKDSRSYSERAAA
jgi:hypothetical protein